MTKLLFQIVAISFLISCGKDKDKCVGDCAIITISGQVVDTPNLIGIKNIPIKIYLRSGGPGIGVNTKDIALTASDNQGKFSVSTRIEKGLFPRYSLYIEPVLNETYLASNYPGASYYSRFEVFQSKIDVRFVLHPKAILNVQLRNTQNQTFNGFTLAYSYSNTVIRRFDSYGPQPIRDTNLSIETASNIYTRVYWSKVYSPGQITDYSDSIICNATGNNTFLLNY